MKRVFVIFGSRSDWEKNPDIRAVCQDPNIGLEIVAHVLSCHRNPRAVKDLVSDSSDACLSDCGLIVCCGGKAFALPGIVDAWSYYFNKSERAIYHKYRVAGVALGEPGSEALLAAQLSIKQLPGEPVLMREDGSVYTGAEGLRQVLVRYRDSVLPPEKERRDASSEYFLYKNF